MQNMLAKSQNQQCRPTPSRPTKVRMLRLFLFQEMAGSVLADHLVDRRPVCFTHGRFLGQLPAWTQPRDGE